MSSFVEVATGGDLIASTNNVSEKARLDVICGRSLEPDGKDLLRREDCTSKCPFSHGKRHLQNIQAERRREEVRLQPTDHPGGEGQGRYGQ